MAPVFFCLNDYQLKVNCLFGSVVWIPGIPPYDCWIVIWVFSKIGVLPNHPILIGFSMK